MAMVLNVTFNNISAIS